MSPGLPFGVTKNFCNSIEFVAAKNLNILNANEQISSKWLFLYNVTFTSIKK